MAIQNYYNCFDIHMALFKAHLVQFHVDIFCASKNAQLYKWRPSLWVCALSVFMSLCQVLWSDALHKERDVEGKKIDCEKAESLSCFFCCGLFYKGVHFFMTLLHLGSQPRSITEWLCALVFSTWLGCTSSGSDNWASNWRGPPESSYAAAWQHLAGGLGDSTPYACT